MAWQLKSWMVLRNSALPLGKILLFFLVGRSEVRRQILNRPRPHKYCKQRLSVSKFFLLARPRAEATGDHGQRIGQNL